MKKVVLIWIATILLIFNGENAFSGDLTCYGYTSTTSHFACGTHGNCVWWAAYKRPDIAAAISGSGWNGGQWYDNLVGDGFDVGLEPKVGAIVEFFDPGHVAYVESLGENGSFSVSEMNWYDSPNDGFADGVNYASYSPNGSTYKRNDSGSWVIKGFIYRRQSGTNSYCDNISSIWGICWTPSSTDVSCQGGINWRLYDFEQGTVLQVSTDEYCLVTGGIGGGGGSDGGPLSVPDFIGNKIWLEDTNGNTKTVFKAGEQIKMKAQFKNVGADSPSDISVKFYLSDGDKVDSNKQTVGGTDNISSYNMESGETQTENETISAPSTMGTRNITACADTGKVVTEEHESNNCTEEAVFRVDDLKWLNPIINYILN